MSTSPTLQWQAAEGADSYQVQVATTSDFSTTLINQSNVQAPSLEAGNLSSSTSYYWRVRAANQAGNSAWSATWSFVTESAPISLPSTPVLSSPANNANNVSTSPTLQWQVAEGADSYQVQVATTSDFSTTLINQSNVQAPSLEAGNLSSSTS
ncbi:fibronectin type III domain-containing protein, partial [Pontibacter sp. BAB1700]|uniref:fibronectin type III domain-containing protein n=1 Tax=Pontibacter sp. BAB1700 TaxID=1144253 RepID=UPI00026BC225